MVSVSALFVTIVCLAGKSLAVGVVGTAPGFAAGTTGGGTATPQYPSSLAELKTWLTDSTARVIVINQELVHPFQYLKLN